jgi:hypothetical protein
MLACIQPKEDIQYPHAQIHKCAAHSSSLYNTQNDLLLHKVLRFYNENGGANMDLMLSVINGTTNISLRIMDWFVTNYSKKHYTVYDLVGGGNGAGGVAAKRFKVYVDYKLKLRAYSKKRFDPFCRWDRINVPHKNGSTYIQTTLGQLNFFKWAIENEVLRYIEENYTAIETDMNIRNNTTRKIAKSHQTSAATVDGCEFVVASCFVVASGSDANSSCASNHSVPSGSSVVSGSVVASKAKVCPSLGGGGVKHRKKREELSSSATKSIKKEFVDIVISFN